MLLGMLWCNATIGSHRINAQDQAHWISQILKKKLGYSEYDLNAMQMLLELQFKSGPRKQHLKEVKSEVKEETKVCTHPLPPRLCAAQQFVWHTHTMLSILDSLGFT